MYSPQLLDHFEHPRNVGELPSPDIEVQVENPACGDIMRLTLKMTGGRIAEVGYKTRGCVAAIACGSALTEMIAGKTPAEASAIRREELVEKLGGLRMESTHASHLAMDCLKAALRRAVELARHSHETL
ncbi:MAG TPA: iron-sulfur cluster assembly scaffold protein [Terriglobales bacterium]